MNKAEIDRALINLSETVKDGDKSRTYRLLQEADYLNGLGQLTRRGAARVTAATR